MIEGHDILCFAPGPWDDIWRNRHQIMTRLARANRILYIEPWMELRPLLRRWRRGEFSWNDLRGPRFEKVRENLHVYSPPGWAPRAARVPLKPVTEVLYMMFLRRVVRRLGFARPILWLFMPQMEIFIGRFDEKLVIYHIVDEYAGYSGVSAAWRPVIQQMEERLARQADLVFVTSPALLERKRRLNERVLLVANAVDHEVFAAFAAERGCYPLPADVAQVGRPIAGYVGAINDKVDLPLLLEVACRCTDWSFVLVGPVKIEDVEAQRALRSLQALPHVHFLGRKSVTEVPRYIAACDVCLLPYRINEWTKNIDSLKLYEYLACGKPVVATDVPAARRFADVVAVATGGEEVIASMREELARDDETRRARRRDIAAANTWDHRVATLSIAIEQRLEEKESERRSGTS